MNDKVIQAIDSERTYQDSFCKDKGYDSHQTVEGELVLMKTYLDKAFVAWSDNKGDEVCLDAIRKVAGIAVRCMEYHGAPLRK